MSVLNWLHKFIGIKRNGLNNPEYLTPQQIEEEKDRYFDYKVDMFKARILDKFKRFKKENCEQRVGGRKHYIKVPEIKIFSRAEPVCFIECEFCGNILSLAFPLEFSVEQRKQAFERVDNFIKYSGYWESIDIA